MRHSTSIGIDTHAKKNRICALVAETGEIVTTKLSEDPKELISWIRAQNFPQPVRCCYESGPTGFGLARELNKAGIYCIVAATSKLPYRSDRQKNDRIDAEWLARVLDSGAVRAVMVPTVDEESLRHLSRLRGEEAGDLRKAKQRVASFLLLTKTSYTLAKKRWTKTFIKWSENYGFEMELPLHPLSGLFHRRALADSRHHTVGSQKQVLPIFVASLSRLCRAIRSK